MADKGNKNSLLEVEDEKQLLQLIKKRFLQDKVYNVIDDVAVSINPCRTIPDESWELYQTADCAVSHLRLQQKNQCIVLTGDSGSGKTENAKRFIARIINSVSALDDDLVNNITQAGIVLESFGNACKSTCENASRVIKFTELLFTQDMKLKGAYIHHYLLEKTRVVYHDKAEGNFHIFYQFLVGMSDEDLEKYQLYKSVCHRYIGSDFDWTRDQDKFQDQINKVNECLRSLGFSEDNLDTIFRILAAILHVGDLTFAVDVGKKKAGVIHPEPLRKASHLLRVSPERLEFSLVTELTQVKDKIVRRLRRIREIEEARDKLAMALYARLFAWIVWTLNRCLTPIDDIRSDRKVISIFDPFGFEKLEMNGMEELCINTTSEHLTYLYNQYVFAWEMEDQENEGIIIQKVYYSRNKDVVDVLMERPEGIFAVIDRQSKTLHGTDTSLVKKLNSKHRKHARYEAVTNCPYPTFTINHYAGKVTYTAANMLSKNKNMLGGSIILCLQDSEDDLLQRLFMVKLSSTGAISTADDEKTAGIRAMPRKAEIKKMRGTVRRRTEIIGNIQGFSKTKQSKEKMIQEKAHLTLESQLRNSLSDFMQMFLKSDLHFVRCIRPNHQLVPYHFDEELVKAQLTYHSVMETVLMRQQGFPVRVAFGPFIQRYKILGYRLTMEVKYIANTCERILWNIDGMGWKVAKTKVFMKNSCRDKLEDKLRKAKEGIVIIQKLFRGRLARRRFKILQDQKQRELIMVWNFLSKVEDKMLNVYNHLSNQVMEEDQRATPMTSQKDLYLDYNEVETKALSILQGKKVKRNKKPPPTQEPVIGARETLPTSSTPDLLSKQNELAPATPVFQTTEEVTSDRPPLLSNSLSDVFGPEAPQTTEEVTSDRPLSLSISDVFEFADPVLSPNRTSGSDGPLNSPEPILSITDSFSSENIDMDQSCSDEETLDETFMVFEPESTITDDFPTDVTTATSQDRPTLVERESNLSTVFFESTHSKDDVDDDMKIAMETPGLWCTITCYERAISRGEFHVDRPVIIVDGSSNAFDVTRIGLGSIPMTPGDNRVEKVRRCVGKGIKLTIDEEGNMWVKRYSKNKAFVKGRHLSKEVIAVKGVLPKGQLLKIFDFESFADNLQYECDPIRYEPERGEKLLASTRVCICFVKDAEQDIDTPCWIEVEMTEPSRITEVALKLAKVIRRKEREKRGDRTPPILRTKIGKSRRVIVVGAWEEMVRPKYYIDSFRYKRKDWASKKVSVNPFAFGSQNHLEKDKFEDSRLRTKSSPERLDNETLCDEFGGQDASDEVFESESFAVAGAGSSRTKRLARANTEGQLLSETKTGGEGNKLWAKKETNSKQAKKGGRSKTQS